MRGGGAVGLLMVDLDRFKHVNDTLGHPVGDALLRKVADRLRSALREGDLLARLGGDEFAIVQTGVGQPGAAERVARRVTDIVARPYIVEGHMIDIGASVGIAVLPDDAGGADELVKRADIALYRAKEAGRGTHRFYEARMDEAMQERRALEHEMRRALAYRQFQLHYQPQQSLETGRVTGFEALLRWNHPERGLIPPDDFIPLAEETGFIVPLGEWVLRQATADAAGWPETFTIAVNVSCRQLADPEFVACVRAALAAAGLEPERFEVEVTESVLMSDDAVCLKNLAALQEMGVTVSIDDFGTGYSSISYLRRFPFDKLKIDQSFIRGEGAEHQQDLVRAIVDISRHFRMKVVAEGVETHDQAEAMRAHGCGSVQGYHVSRPVPLDQTRAIIVAAGAEPAEAGDATRTAPRQPEASPASDGPLRRLVYFSRSCIDALEADLNEEVGRILAVARANNDADGVTGALLFTHGHFAQVLEGEPARVESVFERIQLDPRHCDVRLIEYAPIEARAFGPWAMGFAGSEAIDLPALAGVEIETDAVDGPALVDMLRTVLADEDRHRLAA